MFLYVYRSCVRSAMLYGSETWCLRKNEMAILRIQRTERAMVWAMCGTKLMEKKRTESWANGDVGIEGNSGLEGEWSEVVQACVEGGWWACFEKSVGVWNKGQEEAKKTKEVVEDLSGEREQVYWFGEKWCH